MSEKVNLLRCDGCGGALSVQAYMSKSDYIGSDFREQLLDGDVLAECVLCDGGIMSLDDSGFTIDEEPDIWGFH